MMLELVRASEKYRDQIADMLDEWAASGEKIVPGTIRRAEYHDFSMYLRSLEMRDAGGLLTDATFFCLDAARDIIVGAVSIRHGGSAEALPEGGQIQAGVRPSERGKGISARMTALALEICRAQGMERTLNAGSANNAAGEEWTADDTGPAGAGEISAGVSSGDDKGKEGPDAEN